MSAKVFLLNEAGLKPEKVKRSRAECLCRALLAFKVSAFVYQRLKITPAANPNLPRQTGFIAKPFIPDRLPSHKAPGTKAVGPVVERSRDRQELIRAARHPGLWAPIERAGISAISRPAL